MGKFTVKATDGYWIDKIKIDVDVKYSHLTSDEKLEVNRRLEDAIVSMLMEQKFNVKNMELK